MTVEEALAHERMSMGREITLVGSAEVGGALMVVYDVEPYREADYLLVDGRAMHTRRFAVWADGSWHGGVIETKFV